MLLWACFGTSNVGSSGRVESFARLSVFFCRKQRSDSIRDKCPISTFQRHVKALNVPYLILSFAGFCCLNM